uniref:EasH n=1 Tax=Epichloe typhina x Neotyphodium lolii TaxID=1915362 RepID=S5SNK8_EPINE|nr:putative oxygenase [Epichloe hybrida]AVA32097.1 EasH [Epichloe hybrida]
MTVQSKPQAQVQRFSLTSDPAAVHKALADDGVAIIKGFLSPEQVAKLNADVDPPLFALRQAEKPANPSAASVWMADLHPAHVQRVHNLVGFSKVFRHDILNHELMHDVCRLAFQESGDYWLGYGAAIENGPGTQEQIWHRDQPDYALLKAGPGTAEAMLNFFTALTDFTPETGMTQYIWGSHKRVELGEPDAEHPVVFTKLKAGDTAVLSGKIVHRGSANATPDVFRRALALMIIPAIMTPFDATCHLSRHMVETMTPLAQKMVGRRSVVIPPPHTVGAALGIWCLNMREVGEQMGLKSNQPDKEEE